MKLIKKISGGKRIEMPFSYLNKMQTVLGQKN